MATVTCLFATTRQQEVTEQFHNSVVRTMDYWLIDDNDEEGENEEEDDQSDTVVYFWEVEIV